jgi:hypothetical protein
MFWYKLRVKLKLTIEILFCTYLRNQLASCECFHPITTLDWLETITCSKLANWFCGLRLVERACLVFTTFSLLRTSKTWMWLVDDVVNVCRQPITLLFSFALRWQEMGWCYAARCFLIPAPNSFILFRDTLTFLAWSIVGNQLGIGNVFWRVT